MKIQIFIGTGGVGKTSVAAASGLKAALEGGKCLVLTIDPALRLRTALGLDPAGTQQRVEIDSLSGKGELWAGLLDVKSTLDRAVSLHAKPEQAQTILAHPIYQILIASLSGMQELLAVERIDQAISDGFQTLFIDTAPSRHAFEFLDKPEFFAQLVSFPVVKLVGRTYRFFERSLSGIGRKSIELYSRVEDILGATMTRQILDFYSVFRTIAEGYAERAVKTTSLLRDSRTTSFTIVTTPFKAARDANYLWRELNNRKFYVERLVVNRVWPLLDPRLPADAPPLASELVDWYGSVSRAHDRAWSKVSVEAAGKIPKTIRLPELSRDVDGLPALRQIAANLSQ